MVKNKTLVVIRHAHRNKPEGRDLDNGLSAKGREQARKLLKFFLKRFGKTKPLIYSSPRKRCIETVEKIAKKTKTRVEILDTLNEAVTLLELQRKVREFRSFWENSDAPLMVICSHGDWIPVFVESLTRAKADLDKGGWLEIESVEETPRIRWLLQAID